MSQLYTLHSKALGGFYESDFHAVADSLPEAKAKIRAAFRNWLLDPDNAHRFDNVKLATHGTLVEVWT